MHSEVIKVEFGEVVIISYEKNHQFATDGNDSFASRTSQENFSNFKPDQDQKIFNFGPIPSGRCIPDQTLIEFCNTRGELGANRRVTSLRANQNVDLNHRFESSAKLTC